MCPVSWYGEAVSMLSGAGLVNGYSDGGFHPNEYITRCEFSAIAVRLLGAGELTRAGLFSDTAGCWAEGYINRARPARARLRVFGPGASALTITSPAPRRQS